MSAQPPCTFMKRELSPPPPSRNGFLEEPRTEVGPIPFAGEPDGVGGRGLGRLPRRRRRAAALHVGGGVPGQRADQPHPAAAAATAAAAASVAALALVQDQLH